jgi:hypothetical protein
MRRNVVLHSLSVLQALQIGPASLAYAKLRGVRVGTSPAACDGYLFRVRQNRAVSKFWIADGADMFGVSLV